MNVQYRLSADDLLNALQEWDLALNRKVLLVACGGTALTLNGYKESTKDVDFLVPDPKHLEIVNKVLPAIGYIKRSGIDWMHPNQPWIFQLWRGQRIFQTDLLDPIQEEGKHRVIKEYKHLVLGCLNSDDLIISKMFRGDGVDVQDSIALLKAEKMDLSSLAQRYKETAGYYIDPAQCRRNLGYLIHAMEKQRMKTAPLKEVFDKWKI